MSESDDKHAPASSKMPEDEEEVDLQTIRDMTDDVIRKYRPIFERLSEL